MTKIRVQLDLCEAELKSLDFLRDRCALKSRADTVRLALGLVEWVAQQTDEGNQIISVGKLPLAPLSVPGLTNSLPKDFKFN